jgi:hypothetical protein
MSVKSRIYVPYEIHSSPWKALPVCSNAFGVPARLATHVPCSTERQARRAIETPAASRDAWDFVSDLATASAQLIFLRAGP